MLMWLVSEDTSGFGGHLPSSGNLGLQISCSVGEGNSNLRPHLVENRIGNPLP